MNRTCSRREMLRGSALLLGGIAVSGESVFAQDGSLRGAIAGEPTAARAGQAVLDSGGTAVDAILCAALVAAVVSPHNCGIGGYGGHMIIRRAGATKIVAIDFNSTAPARATADMFPLEKGRVVGKKNEHGWLAAGVPGTIAGIELAARRYGTRSFAQLLEPAIALAENGFSTGKRLATAIQNNAARLGADPGSAALYLPEARPPTPEELHHNRDLARVLQLLARENSVEPFYRGSIAREIASAFETNGGLVTLSDMAVYEAREVDPYTIQWNDFSIYTAPLTAGGLTALQSLNTLRALGWGRLGLHEKGHARIEAMRLAWADRLALLGDPNAARVPVEKLLSSEHASQSAERVAAALKERKALPLALDIPPDHGTVHLSCSDEAGNLVALTLTHGGSFGAQVTVPGLGLTLGHGISRFDPRPGRPNSIGPGKRPLHNMCPTIVMRGTKPALAVGGAGGRKIPNAVHDLLLHYVSSDGSLEAAMEAPRCHTIGDQKLILEQRWPASEIDYLRSLNYAVETGSSALVSAAAFDAASKTCRALSR